MRQVNGTYPEQNGLKMETKRLRVVGEIRIEVLPNDRVVMLMLGDRVPELATALDADHCRKVAEALVKYAVQLDAMPGRIILPGGATLPDLPGDPHDG